MVVVAADAAHLIADGALGQRCTSALLDSLSGRKTIDFLFVLGRKSG